VVPDRGEVPVIMGFMLGSTCSSCCFCRCADVCTLCFTMSDGDRSWNSCTSLNAHDNSNPFRYEACRVLSTQPLYDFPPITGNTPVLQETAMLGQVGKILNKTSGTASPLQPIQIDFATYPETDNGVVFFKRATLDPFLAAENELETGRTELLFLCRLFCSSATASQPAQVFISVIYRVIITKLDYLGPVPEGGNRFPNRRQATEISTQDQFTFNRDFRTAFSSDSRGTNPFGCTGAVHACTADSGDFFISNFEVEASLDGISVSVNDGDFLESRGALTAVFESCLDDDGINPFTICTDYLDIDDAFFTMPTMTAEMTNTGDCPTGNPLP
jgi:hypothetical protein